jgi:hypothetical protein
VVGEDPGELAPPDGRFALGSRAPAAGMRTSGAAPADVA